MAPCTDLFDQLIAFFENPGNPGEAKTATVAMAVHHSSGLVQYVAGDLTIDKFIKKFVTQAKGVAGIDSNYARTLAGSWEILIGPDGTVDVAFSNPTPEVKGFTFVANCALASGFWVGVLPDFPHFPHIVVTPGQPPPKDICVVSISLTLSGARTS